LTLNYVESFGAGLCGLGEYFDQPGRDISADEINGFVFTAACALIRTSIDRRGMPSHRCEFNRKMAGESCQERLQNATTSSSHQPETLDNSRGPLRN